MAKPINPIRAAHIERAGAVAILMGGVGHRILTAAKDGDHDLVRDLNQELLYLSDRMSKCARSDADKATMRQALLAAQKTVVTAEELLSERLRAHRIADRNRPAYRRAETAGNIK